MDEKNPKYVCCWVLDEIADSTSELAKGDVQVKHLICCRLWFDSRCEYDNKKKTTKKLDASTCCYLNFNLKEGISLDKQQSFQCLLLLEFKGRQ